MGREQRQDHRVTPEQNIYSALGNGPYVIGKIIDIGLGGLAFEHTCELSFTDTIAKNLHIFYEDRDFFMTGIPCSVLYSKPQKTSREKIMRCGVKFQDLNEYQHDRLSSLVLKNTFGATP